MSAGSPMPCSKTSGGLVPKLPRSGLVQRLKFLRREADGKTLVELNPGGQRPPYGEKGYSLILGVSVLAVGIGEVKAGFPSRRA